MYIQLEVMLLIMVVGRRAQGQMAVKASHNIEEVPYEECQTVKAYVGLGQEVVFFLIVRHATYSPTAGGKACW